MLSDPQIEIRSTTFRVTFIGRRSYSRVGRGSACPAGFWTTWPKPNTDTVGEFPPWVV
jgi:hypothetical protein